MGVYQRGTGVTLVERFWTVDPITKAIVATNPSVTTVTVEDPNGAEVTYQFGIDLNVTNPSVGTFVCVLTPPLPTGDYRYLWKGTGAVEATREDTFTILPSGVLASNAGQGPQRGPCAPWISGSDVAAICPQSASAVGDQTYLLDDAAAEAYQALFEIAGRRFTGICSIKVRPTSDSCDCWGPSSLGLGPWTWGNYQSWAGVSGWYNETGDRLGCEPMSHWRLSGYPVRKITEVKVDGVVLPEFDAITNQRNWRLDKYRELVRMDAPGPPVETRRWPACQNMSLDDDQPGTFSVTYEYGEEAPQLAKDAAAQLACQLYLTGTNQCQIPQGATRVTRQGVQFDRSLMANWFDSTKATGLVFVDLFLKAYWATRTRRRSAVYSPDLQQFARPDRTTPHP